VGSRRHKTFGLLREFSQAQDNCHPYGRQNRVTVFKEDRSTCRYHADGVSGMNTDRRFTN